MNSPLVSPAKIRFIGADIPRPMAGKTTISRGTTQAGFGKTQWTEILVAAGHQAAGATQALESLCAKYRPPLYAFIRAQGRSPADAEDLVQGFLLHLLAKDRLDGRDEPAQRAKNEALPPRQDDPHSTETTNEN